MIIWLIEFIFMILLLSFFAEIGLKGSCIAFAILYVIDAVIHFATLPFLISSFISGIIAGAIAYFIAKFLLFIIKVMGTIGVFIVIVLFILMFFAIII